MPLTRREFIGFLVGGLCAGPLKGLIPARDLFGNISNVALINGERGVSAAFNNRSAQRALEVTVREPKRSNYIWVSIPAPKGSWDLARWQSVEAEITNRGPASRTLMLWVVGDHGWDAVGDIATLEPAESRTFVCALRDTFPDGTPKLDPKDVKEVRVIAHGGDVGSVFEVGGLKAVGNAPKWICPPGRLYVPDMRVGRPPAGQRVRYQLAGDERTNIYSALYLPTDWKKGGKYPVIAEFPGNIYFAPQTYSIGRPEQCVIGYGMTKGRGAIWVSLPFVDRKSGSIVDDGWGNADETANYAVQTTTEICRKFGGDLKNVVLTGFSRGAIACGYIGLRNKRISSLWKGMHMSQHFDGDGWRGATLPGAIERAHRFSGEAIFQTDNSSAKYPDGSPKLQAVMAATGAKITYAQSNLRAHACAMFLDNRPSTVLLRHWFSALVNSQRG